MKKVITLMTAILAVLVLACACAGSGEPNATDIPKATEETKTEATAEPTQAPTQAPTAEPTQAPTAEPTEEPTPRPKTENVVAGKNVTTDYNEAGQFADPQLMVDEDETTRWSGFDLGRKDPRENLLHTIVIDLEGEFTLFDFTVSFESLTGFYQIDVSDTGADDSWKTVYTYDDYTMNHQAIEDEGNFPADTKAKFVRILIDFPEDEEYTDGDWPYCSIYEFCCYGAAV